MRPFIGRILLLVPFFLLFRLAAQVEYDVTLDSVFEVSADVLGEGALFHARPKVYVLADNGRKKCAKVLHGNVEFANGLGTVRCQWRKAVAPGTYALYVRATGRDVPVEVTPAFNIMAPVVDALTPEWALTGSTVTVTGHFFSSRPGKVRLAVPGGKSQVLPIARPYVYPDERGIAGRSVMELASGQSEFSFVVPKGFLDPVPATVTIETRMGSVDIPFYPDAYDARDHFLVTPVKNQCGLRGDGVSDLGTAVGLCWAFASLSAFESSLLKQGYQTDPEADAANLSPWYLGNYISYNGHPLQFNADLWLDPIELSPPTTYGYIKLDEQGWGGGGGHWTCDYINGGNAVVLWKDAPMPNGQMTLHEDLQKPHPLPSCGYMAKDMFLFDPDDFGSPEEFRQVVKKAVLELGAVQSYVHLDGVDCAGIDRQTDHGKSPAEVFTGHRFMDKANSNYYCYDTAFVGDLTHAICIVGWDNRRAIDLDDHLATGAWLVKDSNGANTHDNGYYWVAFDDAVLLKSNGEGASCFATGFTAHPGTGYKPPCLYQTHAGALTSDDGFYWYQQFEAAASYPLGMGTWACAKFTVDGDERLKAVGIVTMNRNEEVTVAVHKNRAFPPAQNERVMFSQSFLIPEKGYHMLDLRRTLRFADGDTMAIVVKFQHQEGTMHPLVYVTDAEVEMPVTHWTFSGAQTWCDFPEDSAFYLQAVMADD